MKTRGGVLKFDAVASMLKKNLKSEESNIGDAKVDLASIAKKLFQKRSKSAS